MFKTIKRERTITEEVRVPEVPDAKAALRILAGFFGYEIERGEKVTGPIFRSRFAVRSDDEANALAVEAVGVLAARILSSDRIASAQRLGVRTMPDSPAEPTWTSQDGTSTRVRELPTPHLVNILRKYGHSRAGVFEAIRVELRTRKDSEAT